MQSAANIEILGSVLPFVKLSSNPKNMSNKLSAAYFGKPAGLISILAKVMVTPLPSAYHPTTNAFHCSPVAQQKTRRRMASALANCGGCKASKIASELRFLRCQDCQGDGKGTASVGYVIGFRGKHHGMYLKI